MVYGGYSEGFNSGGVSRYVDSQGEVTLSYSPEEIQNYEVGLRADLLDRSLRVNATAFRTDWNGIQYLSTVKDRGNGQEVTELVLQNAADGRAQGVELETTWLATDALTLNANLGFLKTKYISSQSTALPADSDFARAPSKTLNFGATYKWSGVFGGDLTARVVSNYWGSYWRASTLELRQDFQGLQSEAGGGRQLDPQCEPDLDSRQREVRGQRVDQQHHGYLQLQLRLHARHLAVRLLDCRSPA